MSNLNLFVAGSIHQGSERFYSDISRRRQCSFMSFSALLFAQPLPIQQWTASNAPINVTFINTVFIANGGAFDQYLLPDGGAFD